MPTDAIHFFVEDTNYALRNKNLLREWIDKVLKEEQEQYHDLNIILCSDDYLYNLNRAYLSRNYLTDVITFDFSENEYVISGDIYISIDRVRENSGKFSGSLKDELHRVIIHGILHLSGYNDKRKRDKEKMTEKENLYLSLRPRGL
jgi:rRNA maturation RNase YbeY